MTDRHKEKQRKRMVISLPHKMERELRNRAKREKRTLGVVAELLIERGLHATPEA